jgi:hypothetical protein
VGPARVRHTSSARPAMQVKERAAACVSALLRLSLLSGRVVRVRPDIEELGRKRAARDVQIIAALSALPPNCDPGTTEDEFERKPQKPTHARNSKFRQSRAKIYLRHAVSRWLRPAPPQISGERASVASVDRWLWQVQGCPPLPSWLLGPGHIIGLALS